jgi:microcystin-dependent protein
LLCDGSEISQTEYEALYQVIQDTWGTASDSTKFKLPDLRGAFLRGTGTHGTETMANGGSYLGPPVGQFQLDLFQGQYHNFRNASGGTTASMGASNGSSGSSETVRKGSGFAGVWQVRGPRTGANGPVRSGNETRPFSAGVNYIIKL